MCSAIYYSEKFLMYIKRPALALAGFVDKDFANDKVNRKSISVYIL